MNETTLNETDKTTQQAETLHTLDYAPWGAAYASEDLAAYAGALLKLAYQYSYCARNDLKFRHRAHAECIDSVLSEIKTVGKAFLDTASITD